MYEKFYGLKERPFSLLPDPDFLYLGDKHRTALDLLELTIFNQAGFCVISGEIGAGKTTLIRELLNRLEDDFCVGLISNTHPSFGELLQWIMAAFDLQTGSDDTFELHKRFMDFVIEQYADNKRTLLIIDEAQNLSVSALEELRMLSNINSEKDLLLQVILVGQNQLHDKLQLPELRQFAQRIAVDHHLTGLDERETADYIRYRVILAGGQADLFSEESCATIYRCSGGIPRIINRICDSCLVYGYSDQSSRITAALVTEVVNDQLTGHVRTSVGDPPQPGAEVAVPALNSSQAGDLGLLSVSSKRLSEPEPEPVEGPARVGARAQVAAEGRQAPNQAGSRRPTSVAARQSDAVDVAAIVSQEVAQASSAQSTQRTDRDKDPGGLADLEGLVAEGEPGAGRADQRRSLAVLPLAAGLVMLMGTGVVGWLAWSRWDQAGYPVTAAADPADSAASSAAVDTVAAKLNNQGVAAESLVQGEAERLKQERLAAEQREEERLELERREAERLAAQREAERLEQERLAAEQQLAAQREMERLEEERQAAEQRLAELERERLETERRLAAERVEKERREAAARREAERLEQERRAVEQRLAAQREAKRIEMRRRQAERRLAAQRAAEREARRAAALAAWNKANSAIEWAEDTEADEDAGE